MTELNSENLNISIIMNSVESGNIAKIGYNIDHHILAVEFKDGKEYRYTDVPELLFSEFSEHKSPGSFLHSHIKGKFPCFKLEK